jgi:hypothetical protein
MWIVDPKKFSNIICHRSHTKGRTHWRNRERKGNLKLECGSCAPCWVANKIILNLQRPLWVGGQEVMKRCGRNEPMWIAIHKCMEAMLGISLYSYLYPKLTKTICLSYYLLFFLQWNRRRGQNRFWLEVGGVRWDRGRWHKQCTHM